MPRTKKIKPPMLAPAVADPEAKRKVEAAAAHVGLSIQALTDMILDNAMAIDPKKDTSIVDRYTLEDLGKRLWSMMQMSHRCERGQWFSKLTDPQKAAIITVLRHRGFSAQTISQDFEVPLEKVNKTWNAYSGQMGTQVLGLRLDTIAGQVQAVSERAQEMAMLAGDHKAFWAIEKDKVKVYQSIGIVDRAIHRVEVTHKIDDEQRAEIDRLVQIEAKTSKASERVKLLDTAANTTDAVPEGVNRDLDVPEDDVDDER